MEILIGTLTGVLAAIICTAFYTKGVRDGARVRSTRIRKPQKQEADGDEKELERKFDAILEYDPYGTQFKERTQGENT